nr:reverse transcriptase domain-containing protein [Tanacetum cinerariifolium]
MDQDSLNSAAGGNFLDKIPRECLAIIERKSKVCYSRNKPFVAKVGTNTSTSGISPDVAELKDMVKALLLDNKSQNQAPAILKAVEESFNYNQGNTSCHPLMMSNQIPPPGFPPVPNNQNVQRNDQNHFIQNQNRGNNFNHGPVYQPSVFQPPAYQAPAPQIQGQNMQNQLTNLTDLLTKFVNSNNASTSSSGTLPSNTISNQRSDLKAITSRSGVSYDGPQIPPSTSFLPKFGPSIKSLLTNKDKLSELARIPLNEHCSVVLLKKLPKKLGDPGKFLIPCDFPRKAECLALADLGTSIDLMPLSVWNKLSLPNLSPTCMNLELAGRLVSHPVRVAEDVYVKVGSFHFSADFVVVDFDVDPRVPLILGRSFLKTGRALIDVFEGELTLHVGKEAITFNLNQTSRYSANYSDMTAKRIDVIDMACEEYSHDVLEVDAFFAIEDDPTSSKVDQSYLDPEGDILLLEAFLNDDPSLPPPNQGNYMPEVHKELKIYEAKSEKSSVDEPLEEKTALITVLKSHKLAIAWKLSDIKGIDPEFCTHKILMEEDFEPAVQHQRKVIPKIHDVIKQEVLKLLDAGLIYPIFDSLWVSPVHCVPKKGGFTVVENEDNELISTRLVTGWRICINYRKLKEATRKDHFPLSFMDKMLERLAGNQYYCFLDDFFGYFQIPIDPKDQEKTTFPCPYETFAYRRMPFGLCNAPGMFQRCMMAIFHDMIEKTMEVFMDDFSVFGNSFQSCLSHLERMLKR